MTAVAECRVAQPAHELIIVLMREETDASVEPNLIQASSIGPAAAAAAVAAAVGVVVVGVVVVEVNV
jgi:hypothetical protein